VGHASRSSGLLHVKASRGKIFQSGLKTSGVAARMVHVASSWRLRRGQVEDRRFDAMSCVRPYYSCFVVFIVSGPRGNLVFLVFCLDLSNGPRDMTPYHFSSFILYFLDYE
jgi:hypothetical protein